LLANFYISAHPVNILFVFLPSCKLLAPNWDLCRVFHSSFTPFAPSQLHCCWKRFLAGLFSYCGEQVRLSIIRVVYRDRVPIQPRRSHSNSAGQPPATACVGKGWAA